MARHYCLIVDELFEKVSDLRELKDHVKIFCRAIHEANGKQSARVFGVNKHSPSGFIKNAIREQPMPLMEYNTNFNRKKT